MGRLGGAMDINIYCDEILRDLKRAEPDGKICHHINNLAGAIMGRRDLHKKKQTGDSLVDLIKAIESARIFLYRQKKLKIKCDCK